MDTPKSQKQWARKWIASAWIGSVLFHAFLLLIVLLVLYLWPLPDSAPGELNAFGGIVVRQNSEDGRSYTDSDQNEFGEAAQRDQEQSTAPTLEETMAGDLSDLNDLNERLPSRAIGPQSASGSANRVPGGTQLADSLRQRGNQSRGPGTGLGGKAAVRIFGAEGTGSTFVYVFDRSGSMNEFGGKPMRAAKTELIQSLQALGNFHKFNIVFYNEEPTVLWAGKMNFADDKNKETARKFVEGIISRGGTRHRKPLVEAIRLKPDVIFFLTDGEERDALTPGQLNDIERLNHQIGGGVQINVIQFGAGQHRESDFLRKLAAQNRGQYVYIDINGLR